ncbi:hypothetical protein HB779_17455 [Phyllobacterium sp. 628]|uniref:hypothetical protein n=1 Tax=Phyllobacterium sp. 628 TaxID=2718938 RepID=UPI00166259AA|nr:hypothetical protein [Phyllobacterium sp. 628]QND53474.1 hypothetical protein HB779_17455 [Phyllobacterium sp. 628]
MTANLTDKISLANTIKQNLSGTCMRTLEGELEDAGHAELINDEEFLRLFDDRCFLCGGCGWWHDTDELADADGSDLICVECAGDGEDEE